MKNIVPAFRPSFTVDRNGKRTYDLIPERISLVKYGEKDSEDGSSDDGDNTTPTEPTNPSDKGDSSDSGSDSQTGGGSNTGGDTDSGGTSGGNGNMEYD